MVLGAARPLGAVLVALLTACTGGPATTQPAATSPAPSGLRGHVVAVPTCPDLPSDFSVASPAGSAAAPTMRVEIAPDDVTTLRLCPLQLPPSDVGTGAPVDLTGTDSQLRPLLAALALPNEPAPSGEIACAAYADLPQTLLATLSDGSVVQLEIPTDRCAHYQHAASEALVAARTRGSGTVS
jgi:hypothetical protein